MVCLGVIEEPPTGGLGPLGLSSHEKRKLQQSSGKHNCEGKCTIFGVKPGGTCTDHLAKQG